MHRNPSSPLCERIVLGPAPGRSNAPRPPVRIFVGTEPAQYRAERVFVYSIEQARDPSRVYEITLMKRLPGFRTWFWNTGFTNYRFAVPELAGFRGRAIYNDVDQIYLDDPAELFDLDLGPHGFLAVSETDTSVMLMDCAQMGRFWTLERARRLRKYTLIDRARAVGGSWGQLPPEWNARDEEHAPGESRCLHYTTIHKQPWRPFPERFYYQPNPVARPWLELEQEADLEGYQVFGPDHPSREWSGTLHAVRPAAPAHELEEAAARDAIARCGARTVLEIVGGDAPRRAAERSFFGCQTECLGLDRAVEQSSPEPADVVVVSSGLDEVPGDDLPWVIERLFRHARRAVVAQAASARPPRRRRAHPPTGTIGLAAWWEWVFRSAAARHPRLSWQIAIHAGRGARRGRTQLLHGGRRYGEDPRVWVLTDHKPGHSTQSVGLAEELGWATERIDLAFGPLAELPNGWIGRSLRGLRRDCARRLAPPWPDLVIAAGRRTAPVAGWIRDQSEGRTRTVQMGRIGAFAKDRFDLAVAPAYACLYPDPRRIETAAPITRVCPAELERARERWRAALETAPVPRLALLVGGDDAEHEFGPDVARRLGSEVAELARREGGSVLVTTSRRTSGAAADALEEALGETVAHFHRWQPEAPGAPNPYLGYLALADALVVTGESASMLSEACATGRPVYIHPLPVRTRGPRAWWLRVERALADALTRRAYARPVNRRGIERPQRGLEHLCAGMLALGRVRTSGHSRRLHEVLVERGLASCFDGKLSAAPHARLSEVSLVADRVRALMGVASQARSSRRSPVSSARRREPQRPSRSSRTGASPPA